MDTKFEITSDIEQVCSELAERYKRTLQEAGKVASGDLVNSVDCIAEIKGQYVMISYLLADHWQYVENGRRAGAKQPPLDAIENWIRIKNIVPSSTNGKVPTTRQLAFVIARSIALNGIEPTHALQHTIDNADSLVDKIRESLEAQIEAIISDDTKDIQDI